MTGLDEYRRKRRRGRTPEPLTSTGRGAGRAPLFVVQRHAARRLHYDLRLEGAGALASWAVPKGLPTAPGSRRLAVRVEDHPLEYATFEGEIPPGEYGAGTVEIWDSGTYELVEEKADGGLTVRLRGRRLRGEFALVPAALDGDPRNWLLIRKADGRAPERARPRYRPMLATAARDLPAGDRWVYEVKWDGYRALARLAEGDVELWSRGGRDLAGRFPTVVRALPRALRSFDCVVDGEVCALDAAGRPSFALMQRGQGAVVYELFDLLELDGEPLLELPLRHRRERLEGLVERSGSIVRLSETFDDGPALSEAVRAQGLEGVVAKRAGSLYRPGLRTRDWLKVKAVERATFLIAGYTRGSGRRAGSLGALVLAERRDGELVWAGNCGTGFTDAELERLLARLRPLERATPPFSKPPRMPRVRRGDVVWVTPRLACEVTFAERTREGRLRAPSYAGLREADEPAREAARRDRAEVEIRRGRRSLLVRNLDKVFWPESGVTKGDLVEYYRRIAPVLVPHLRGRPFTMKRYPDGVEGEHFFQKDAPVHMPAWIETVSLPATSRDGRRRRTIRYPLVNDELALLWMVGMGCIDMNATLSRADRPHRPDLVLFDLDPAEDSEFPEAVRVALLVKDALDALGLPGYPKTSGAAGVHVLVPIARRHGFEDSRRLVSIVAGALARAHPGLVTTEWTRSKRRGVLVDAGQNREGATVASAYSVRPRPGAPVSTPLRWQELTPDLDPRDFTMAVVLDRVARHGDLLAPALGRGRSIAAALRAFES